MNDGVSVRFDHPPNVTFKSTSTAEGDDARPPSTSLAAAVRAAASTPVRAPVSGLVRFPVSPRSKEFLARHFPQATTAEWVDWRWQMRNRVRTLAQMEHFFSLSDDERAAAEAHSGPLPVGITPYYTSLMDPDDAADPLRRTHLPVMGEYQRTAGEFDDPLGEDHDTAAPGLVHRYPDRVLFLVSPLCSTYCRYCTRSRMVGEAGEYEFGTSQWEKALAYIESHTEVRDVLLSGGDPLAMSDDKLDYLLGRLRRIRHVEFLRIGTKMPTVTPMRVTRDLVRVLKKHHPLWMSIHFTHPGELTPEVTESTARLADAGIPLGSQTVLLAGINDNVATMKTLMHGLLKRRVKPYYLYQCDPIKGSAHFRTPVARGLEIIEGLRGHTSGYAVPTYVIDAPGGGGKIPLLPHYVVGRDGDDLLLRNFEGNVYRYTDPDGDIGRVVAQAEEAP